MNKIISFSILLATLACTTVETGHRGVETRFGKVVSESLPEGLYFYNPFTTSMVVMDTRVLKLEKEIECYTKDIQQAKIKYSVNYYLDKTKVHVMLQNVGPEWEEKLVPQTVEGAIKEVIGQWDAVTLISQRSVALTAVTERVAKELKEKDVFVSGIQLTNIDYNAEFEHAIEAKVTAIQNAEQAKNKTVQVQEEANQRVIAAQAEAKSMQIRSEALNKNQNLVQYEAVQKWDGKLPQYMLNNAMPFLKL